MAFSCSSISSSETSCTGRFSSSVLTSTGSKSGITWTARSKARSAWPASTFSMVDSSSCRSGDAATRTFASSSACCCPVFRVS